ncbi:endonuclease domain-containing protein [Devosia sp.]|uniref:endonuclease domain-containing protein n=1 Tax=Devosia sp. TaxID=1871048 RepID=UPI003BAC1A20
MGGQAVTPHPHATTTPPPPRSPSPPVGEGARRADEGLSPPAPPSLATLEPRDEIVADPSSGASRHLLPQGEKGQPRAQRKVVEAKTRSFAKRLRSAATPHEELLWHLLRDRRLVGYKFRRQVPVGPYIADFACHSARLIIELDGSQHAESLRDEKRDAVLRAHGYRILRLWNNDLTKNRNGVLEAIWQALQPSPHPPFGHPLPQGERDEAAPSHPTVLPSPLEREGGASAPGEGTDSQSHLGASA